MAGVSSAEFLKSSAADAGQVDRILRHYGSPHTGSGSLIVQIAKAEGVNPLIILAIMQEETAFGNAANNPGLKPENIANPLSVHFNAGAAGIGKLRMPDGSLPGLGEAIRRAAKDLRKAAGSSPTPLETVSRQWRCPVTWAANVSAHYRKLATRL